MAQYTHLTAHEIRLCAKKIGLDVRGHSPIAAGSSNSNYLLETADKKYVLTLVDDKTIDGAYAMIDLLDHLVRYDFPTSKTLPALTGEPGIIHRDKVVFIKEYIPGENVEDIPFKGLQQLGTVLAQLHAIPGLDTLPQNHDYGLSHFPKAFAIHADQDFEDWLAGKQRYLEEKLPTNLPRSIIHGDVFWDNILYLDGEFQALIDFEDAAIYYQVYDLASALFGACIEEDWLNFEKAKQIITGYQSIRILTNAERAALPLFVEYAAIAISYWRYMKYNLWSPTEERQNYHRQTAKLADMLHTFPADEFEQLFTP